MIEGIPLFKGQSIKNQVPTDIIEIEECINNMLKRISSRAERLVESINQ